MSKLAVGIFLAVLLLIVGTFGFLATWDIPPPSRTVEKVVPNDRFPK